MAERKDVGVRTLRKSSDFVERIALGAVVSFSNDGAAFIIDFLKPSLDIVVDEKGGVIGLRGELELNVRILLPPIVCKKLLRTLEKMIKRYESQFGEIPVKEVSEEQ